MVKDYSDSERGNPLPQHGLLFPVSSKGTFICIIPQTGYTYHGLCYTSRAAVTGMRNSSMGCLGASEADYIPSNLHIFKQNKFQFEDTTRSKGKVLKGRKMQQHKNKTNNNKKKEKKKEAPNRKKKGN